jgi:prephenate dehydrogenase
LGTCGNIVSPKAEITRILYTRAMEARQTGPRWPYPVVVVGYGHFGQALATLLTEAAVDFRVIDPHVEVPAHLNASGATAFAGARHVFLCVPVWAFGEVLAEIRPHLGAGHVVIDVSSVRSGPEDAMRASLDSEVPWVGTHPLFGPSSVAVGERPLRVVVTPNEVHEASVAEVVALYEHLGCRVKLEEAAEHDRRMAYSHALAFFVAKCLMDMGVPTDSDFVPPSFRSFARTVESVRSDAGHLFLSIQNLNPHSAEAREALLAGLERLHEELRDVDPAKLSEPITPALRIPDLGAAAPELRETRDHIDELDREIVRVIARRAQLSLRVGQIKREHGSGVRDPGRERKLLAERRKWALEEDLDPEAVTRVFEALMALARGAQEEERTRSNSH